MNATSDAWVVFTQRQCDKMGMRSDAVSVTVDTDKNLENSARAARYHAFRGFNPAAIVLAHHADDQVETLKRFAQGDLECLVTCHKVSEGIDIKS